jgi:hypothetical protein
VTAGRGRVYVIGDPTTDGPVKIGTTINLPLRLDRIRAGAVKTPAGVNLAAVQVLADHPGGGRLERSLHRYYAAHRLVGEWFALFPSAAGRLMAEYVAETSTVEAITAQGTACTCWTCAHNYPPALAPRDRPELAGVDRLLLVTIEAMTHARLGVNEADEHVPLPASHCDIDRAIRLLEVQASVIRSSGNRYRVAQYRGAH